MTTLTALATALALLAATGVPFCVWWWRMRHWGLPVRVKVDPCDPQPVDIVRYLAEIARRLDAHPERMRVVFDGRNETKRAISLDLDGAGNMRVEVEGERARRVELRGRWIADHPVPLDLRHAVLYIAPVDANRFRVQSRIPFRVSPFVYAGCSLVATIGVILLQPVLLALAFGGAVGSGAVGHLART